MDRARVPRSMRWQAVAPLGIGLAVATTLGPSLLGGSSALAQLSVAPLEPSAAGSGSGSATVTPPPAPDPGSPTAPADATPPAQPAPATDVPIEPSHASMPTSVPDHILVRGEGFRFGSYGRAIAGSDLRGGKPEKVLIVAHGPRIVEDSYLELDFSYGFVRPLSGDNYVVLRPIVTLAFDGTLFHDTGEFDAHPALRNVFLDARLAKSVTAWAGSRMYRGDDIYLFDYWPLDDQNMVGGGIEVTQQVLDRGGEPGQHAHDDVTVAAAVGFNRLNHPFQFQEIEVANPVQGATTVEQLNRQRIVASATATYAMVPSNGASTGAKLKLHTEVHALPAGTRKREDGTLESLPADTGFLIGAEVGVFGLGADNPSYRRHLNVFARYAKGLAAFDELAPPTSFGRDLKTGNANELSFGLSGNFDHQYAQLMLGALSRRFIDADTTAVDPDDGWEYAVAARPLVRIVPDWYAGADVSYQARFPRGLNPITLRAEDAAMFQIAPMIAFSPMGPSSYDRPQLRLVYRAAHLNDAALDTYVPDDPRHAHTWVHFLGLQAEWWFNSSTYR